MAEPGLPPRFVLKSRITLQNRLDQMYLDKLDGRIDAEFFDRKAAEWRAEEERVRRAIREHEGANENYMESGVQLLKLASRAVKLFQKQKPSEKRRLLNFVLSNCTWKDGQLHATFRQPFDMLAVTTTVHAQKKAAGATSKDLCPIWLPGLIAKANLLSCLQTDESGRPD